MIISHKYEEQVVERNVNSDVGFLITNRVGGYYTTGIKSKHSGLFYRDEDEIIKIIEEIRSIELFNKIENNFWCTKRIGSITESYFMPIGKPALVYELSKKSQVEILFDVRRGYDYRIWGREYHISTKDGKIVIEFRKKTDHREDLTSGNEEYNYFIVISHKGSFDILDDWENKNYDFDAKRNSHPTERFVYKGIKINTKELIITYSNKLQNALKTNKQIEQNLAKLKKLQIKYAKLSIKNIKEDELNIATKTCTESLDNLVINQNDKIGVYAGLPWFTQFWSRDTLISLKALMLDNEFTIVKNRIFFYLSHISDDGLLPNRFPSTETKCADSIGWLFKRIGEFLEILDHRRIREKYISKIEYNKIINQLEKSINNVFRKSTRNSLAINGSQETWMDSFSMQDGRSGARIEIQALRLCMYELLFRLTKNRIYDDMIDKMIKSVRSQFWNGKYLTDGSEDPTIRPNVFIAYYLYPNLLSKREWNKCFDYVIPKLWLNWGGFSTVDKTDSRFIGKSTGENPASYHNGDSWFWVNNLAALVLSRIDKNKYSKYISKIVQASKNEILYNGYVGCHSEISSADKMESLGCLNQAWSNAMFIELIEEFYS